MEFCAAHTLKTGSPLTQKERLFPDIHPFSCHHYCQATGQESVDVVSLFWAVKIT